MKSFLGKFYRHLAIFSGHTGTIQPVSEHSLVLKDGLVFVLSLKVFHFFRSYIRDHQVATRGKV